MADRQLADVLRQTPLFQNLHGNELHALIQTGKEQTFEPDQPIVREGEDGMGFYLVLDGKVAVRKAGQPIATLEAGDYFGEMALLNDEGSRSADVIAQAPTRCLVITRWDLRALIRNNPDLAWRIQEELGRRLSETAQALSE